MFHNSYIQLVKGTGPDGRITADDVKAYVPSPAAVPGAPTPAPAVAAPRPAPSASGDFIDIPLTNIREVSQYLLL